MNFYWKLIKKTVNDWVLSIFIVAIGALIVIVGVGVPLLVISWTPEIVGYPFYLLYSKVFQMPITPSEAFWVTVSAGLLALFVAWYIRYFVDQFADF